MNNTPRNHQIKAAEVRVVDENGDSLGVLSLSQGLKLAQERGLDLIQVTDKAVPPVCRIMEYGKFLYLQQKKDRSKKQKGSEVKGIRLTFNISAHDIEVRVKAAEKFLQQGHRLKIELPLRGRQKALQEHATSRMQEFLKKMREVTTVRVDQPIKREGRGLSMLLVKDKAVTEKENTVKEASAEPVNNK